MAQRQADFCVVGAGYAGLTAALRLQQAGKSVIVLEARNRVGGRVFTETLPDGTWLDYGGTWLGPGQHAAYNLVREFGIRTYRTWDRGDTLVVLGGHVIRLPAGGKHDLLAGLDPSSLFFEMIDAEARKIPLDAPWQAPNADALDAQTMTAWADANFPDPTGTVQAALEFATNLTYTARPSEVSALYVLWHVHSCDGSAEKMLAVTGGSQQDRVQGGMQAIANAIAARLGDAVCLEAPVRTIDQDDSSVTVIADTATVRARRVIVTAPPTLASHIQYNPPLPTDKALLLQRITAGWVIKAAFLYEESFWRKEGLTGQSWAPQEPVGLTLDGGFESDRPGLLLAFAAGAAAQALGNLNRAARKAVFVEAVVKRFGPKAATFTFYGDHDWAAEEWTRGCYMAHYPPGVMTSVGPALRLPVGRIHFAGTETSHEWNGWINGAIASGERVAPEVL